MRPPSLHSNFFSSLKQVEKRLKLETPQQTSSTQQTPLSLSTPMFLHINQENSSCSVQEQQSSGPPQTFLSTSPQFLQARQNPSQDCPQNQLGAITGAERRGLDDIELLMQLLGLSDFQERSRKEEERECCCGCEGGFYAKIVGVKGPKCEKEVERLEEWINYFLSKEERRENLRLAFLVLGKAAAAAAASSPSCVSDLEFPCAIEDFLKFDPPRK